MKGKESTYELTGTLNFASESALRDATVELMREAEEARQGALAEMLLGRWSRRHGASLTFDNRFVIPEAVAMLIERLAKTLEPLAQSGSVAMKRLD